ncbi:hypothetical protein RBB50_012063 [Rhinocladiella similis]
MASDTSSPFCTRLLPELRLKIYEHVVSYDRPILLSVTHGYLTKRTTADCKPPALLRVNKQIRDEMVALLASESFFRLNTFTIAQFDISRPQPPSPIFIVDPWQYPRRPYLTLPQTLSGGPSRFLKRVSIENTTLGPVSNFSLTLGHFLYYAPNLEELTLTFERSAFLIAAAIELSRACKPGLRPWTQNQTFPPTLFLSISVLTPRASSTEINPPGYNSYEPAVEAIRSISSQANFDHLVNDARTTARFPPRLHSTSLKQLTLVGRMPDRCVPMIEGYLCPVGGGCWVRTSTTHGAVEPESDLTGTKITYVWSSP